MTLSIVLPCYNEEGNVEPTVRACFAWMMAAGIPGEVIAVNDGSADQTRKRLENLTPEFPNLVVVNHETNQGYGAALRSGCDRAKMEVTVFMDSDGQFHPEDIALLLNHLDEADFVTGIRKHRADPFNRKLNAAMYGFLVRVALGIKLRDINCGMKLWKTAIWKDIRPVRATGALFNAEIFLHLKQKKIPWAEEMVPHYARLTGAQTGANLTVILRMFKELRELRKDMHAQHKATLTELGAAATATRS
ncbi:MAG: glycosyltransferase family 2 protein [Candidatus Peregrinibacteria bacterium]|nr:glycosyltransferase family 2 protein [Candidatus Peregrinibacteria bacterium]